MKAIYFLIILFVSSLVSAQEINQLDANGKRHGIWKKNFEKTKVLRYEGEFDHGKEIGTFKFYKNIDNEPVLTATRTFNETNDLAEVHFFSSKKKLISEGKMRGKTYVGKWIYYHNDSNQIMTEEFYNENGKLEGERKTYYLSGKLAENAMYKNGVFDGESLWYSEAGQLIRVFNYKNGALNGVSKSYDSKGNIELEGIYKDDLKHGIWKYYENGKLVREKDFTKRSKNPYKNKQ